MPLTTQNSPTPTSVAPSPYIAPGASEEGQGETVYVVALLDSEGKPVSYLTEIVDQSTPSGWGQRLQPDVALAWKFTDKKSAEQEATAFSSVSGNPHLQVIPLP
jgi:hypothetical protein